MHILSCTMLLTTCCSSVCIRYTMFLLLVYIFDVFVFPDLHLLFDNRCYFISFGCNLALFMLLFTTVFFLAILIVFNFCWHFCRTFSCYIVLLSFCAFGCYFFFRFSSVFVCFCLCFPYFLLFCSSLFPSFLFFKMESKESSTEQFQIRPAYKNT